MSWPTAIFLMSVVWAIVAFAFISAWHDGQKRKPRTIVDLLKPSERQLTTLSIHPYDPEDSEKTEIIH